MSEPSLCFTTLRAGQIPWRNTRLGISSASRESKKSRGRSQVSIWRAMLITELEFRTAFAWARKPRRRSAPYVYQRLSRRNQDAIHVAGQTERLVDLCVGIKRQKKVLDQKIECRSRHREA